MGISIRKAKKSDQNQLDTLLHFGRYIHKHLDWRPAKDWIESDHYYVGLKKDRIVGALAVPPEPPGVFWLRLFTTSERKKPDEVWKQLWEHAREEILEADLYNIAALSTRPWMNEFLEGSGFTLNHKVIVLEKHLEINPMAGFEPRVELREMTEDDLEGVEAVDHAAFKPLWQNSLIQLKLGFQQAFSAQVALKDEQIVGYQISTPTPYGAHLARLAVNPEMQGKGVGSTLVYGLFNSFLAQKTGRITVNTQQTNSVSQTLYLKTGFSLTGDEYPVYEYPQT